MRQLGLFIVMMLSFSTVFAQNYCGNGYKIFDVPKNKTPKTVDRLGAFPEFPALRHLKTESQVYSKIKSLSNDPTYGKEMNQLFVAMGYTGVNDPSFTQDDIEKSTLPFGAMGMMGDGRHNYTYSILVVNNKQTLDCWKIAAKESSSCNIYFMSDCGNAFYYTNPPTAPVANIIQMPDKKEVNLKIKVYARYTPEACDCCAAWGDDMLTAANYNEEQKVLLSEEKINNIEIKDNSEVVIEKIYIDVDKGTFRKLKKHETERNNDKTEVHPETNYTKR